MALAFAFEFLMKRAVYPRQDQMWRPSEQRHRVALLKASNLNESVLIRRTKKESRCERIQHRENETVSRYEINKYSVSLSAGRYLSISSSQVTYITITLIRA